MYDNCSHRRKLRKEQPCGAYSGRNTLGYASQARCRGCVYRRKKDKKQAARSRSDLRVAQMGNRNHRKIQRARNTPAFVRFSVYRHGVQVQLHNA